MFGYNSQKENEKEAIWEKYHLGIYQASYSLQNIHYQESIKFEPEYFKQIRSMVESHIKYTLKKDYQFYDTQVLHQKIMQDKKLHGEKEGKFLTHLKSYVEKISDLSSKIATCNTLVEADNAYEQFVSFYDINVPLIHTELNQALQDFQVKMVGEYPEGN